MSSASAMAMAGVAATRALYLDDDNALAHAALGNVYRERRDWKKAENEYEQALAIDPDSALILEDYVQFLLYIGRNKEALKYAQHMAQLEPNVAYIVDSLATALLQTGELEEGVKVLRRVRALDLRYSSPHSKAIAALVFSGHPEEARQFFQESIVLGFDFGKETTAQINWLVEPGHFKMPPNGPDAGNMQIEVWAASKNIDEYLSYRARRISWHRINDGYDNFNPHNDYMFSDPRFKKFLVDLGLVDYFWATGKWPDVCRPISDDDFECGST